MGFQDKAKHLATLFLEDISDLIIECIDSDFGFSRYAERIGRSANSFDELYEKLSGSKSKIVEITLDKLEERLADHTPKLVCISVPFPGNLYSAFRCAQYIKEKHPNTKVAMGGGFANTELRSVSDPRVFEFFDYITLDDGELPIELLVECVSNQSADPELKRTFWLIKGKVNYLNNSKKSDYKQSEIGTPDYSHLLLDKYISVIEIANPMHSLWSDGRWNKLTMAHGCYWGKCTFCDISLDYIKLYEPIAAKTLVDRMQELIEQTGERGFHFVDEAAPPALMRELALEIIRRDLIVTWWTNIRFEKSFTSDLCRLLKASGCIAVSGGLEVASDRLLKLIDKGVTVQQVARVTNAFTESGIMVHAYLMYGYPTQTVQETIDSLEMVRQLFEAGVIQSGFWHQFALTAHSPIGLNPDAFGITPDLEQITFANNDVQFEDHTGIDHNQFSYGLKKSLYNYMHGVGFDLKLQDWFEFKIPKTKVNPSHIIQAIELEEWSSPNPNSKVIWLGGVPKAQISSRSKKGKVEELLHLEFDTTDEQFSVQLGVPEGNWLVNQLKALEVKNSKTAQYRELKSSFEAEIGDFEPFWFSKQMNQVRSSGLILI
ncbi:radical SAM protein, partial [Salibacteraceae bacterium]|nr:radical SAM protein [Salibacteraceae bacterium]